MITNDGTIDICSKFELRTPIKNPNKANVNETNISKKIQLCSHILVSEDNINILGTYPLSFDENLVGKRASS